MIIKIVDIDKNVIRAESEIGCFEGKWCSSTPIIFKKYIVELDCADVITPTLIELSLSCVACIEQDSHTTKITGIVEDIEDNLIFLRVEKDLLMLNISSRLDFEQYIGLYVRITVNTIEIYDTGIL